MQPTLLKEMLTESLGLLVIVKKSRTLFMYRRARIQIDCVEGLGDFLEFEIPDDIGEDSESMMAELRVKFGIEEKASIAGSYCDLLLGKSPALGS